MPGGHFIQLIPCSPKSLHGFNAEWWIVGIIIICQSFSELQIVTFIRSASGVFTVLLGAILLEFSRIEIN